MRLGHPCEQMKMRGHEGVMLNGAKVFWQKAKNCLFKTEKVGAMTEQLCPVISPTDQVKHAFGRQNAWTARHNGLFLGKNYATGDELKLHEKGGGRSRGCLTFRTIKFQNREKWVYLF